MLVAIRHGRTDSNENGHERVRSLLPIPLNARGQDEVAETARILGQLKFPFQDFLVSPVLRTQQTAHIISQIVGLPPQPEPGLSDWDFGVLSGKDAKVADPIIDKYMKKPSLVIPQGESYDSFAARTAPVLRRLMAGQAMHLAVTHNRVITFLRYLLSGDRSVLFKKGLVEPAGIVLVKPDGTISVLYKGREPEQEAPTPMPPVRPVRTIV